MSVPEQVVEISPRATAFTAVCVACSALGQADGYAGATFAGRLELDLRHGTFLCRRGHVVRVERAVTETGAAAA